MNDRPPQKQDNGKSPVACMVDGCPLPGTYRMTNDSSLCCVHDGEDPSAWGAQTDRIKSHLRLAWLMLAMSNAMAGEAIKRTTVDEVLAAGGPDDADCNTQRAYAQKIRAWVIRECKGERKAPVQLTPVKALVAKLTAATHD